VGRAPIGGIAGVVLLVALFASSASAQRSEPLRYEHLAGPVYWVTGGGGANVSFSAGPDGVLIVDSKNERAAREILDITGSLTSAPVRYLINGHEHPDHTDGNERIARTGAAIIAHESVRDILMAGQRGGPPAPEAAWPTITYPDNGGVSIEINGETVDVFHVPAAHAAGNSIVHYRNSNVLHVGDLFSPNRYPVIAGGTYEAFITGLNMVVQRANVDTIVIPGSGPLSDREGLIAYREMLIVVRDRVIEALDAGLTLEEFVATKPTVQFDATYGDPGHPLFLPVLYAQMSARRQ
jgi:cyclase